MQTSLTAKEEELQNPQSSGCSPHCWLSTEAPWNSGSCSPHREAMMCHDSRKTEKTERGRPTASEEYRQRRQTDSEEDRQIRQRDSEEDRQTDIQRGEFVSVYQMSICLSVCCYFYIFPQISSLVCVLCILFVSAVLF